MADTFDSFPIIKDFTAVQSSDWSTVFRYLENGVAKNLTGYSAEMTVWDDANTLLTTITSPTDIVLGGSLGTITPKISDTILAGMTAGSHNFTLWLINTNSDRIAFAAGRFNVRKALR